MYVSCVYLWKFRDILTKFYFKIKRWNTFISLFQWGILVAVLHAWNVCSCPEMYLLILFTFQLKQMKLKFPKEINFADYLPRSP